MNTARSELRFADAQAAAPGLRQGIVASGGATPMIVLDGRTRPALRAFSCMIEPREGDVVLLCGEDQLHILAVLTRPGLGDAVLSLPDPAATLGLKAQAIAIEGATTVRVEAPEVSLKGASVRLLASTATWLGKTLTLLGQRLTASVVQSETVAQRVVTKAGSRVTVVDGADTEHVGSRVSTVEGVSTEATGSTIITSHEDVRVDAKRITLG
jgi:hypothetical protein